MRLDMCASWAHRRCFGSFMQVSAIQAPPDHRLTFLEHRACFDVGRQVQVALFMLLFGNGNRRKDLGNLTKALLNGYFGERRIHVGPFIMFTGCTGFEVFHRRAYHPSGKCRLNFNLPAFKKFE